MTVHEHFKYLRKLGLIDGSGRVTRSLNKKRDQDLGERTDSYWVDVTG